MSHLVSVGNSSTPLEPSVVAVTTKLKVRNGSSILIALTLLPGADKVLEDVLQLLALLLALSSVEFPNLTLRRF